MNSSYGNLSQDWGSQLWINPHYRGSAPMHPGYTGSAPMHPGYGSYGAKSAADRCATAQGKLAEWKAKRTGGLFRPSAAKKARKIAEFTADVDTYCRMAAAETAALEAEGAILTEAAAPVQMPVVATTTSSGSGAGTAVLALLGLGAVGALAYFLLR